MKSVAFFRKSWKKKDKDKNATKGQQDMSTTKRVVLVPESAPCTPIAMTFDIPVRKLSPSPDHRMRSQSEDAISFYPSLLCSHKSSCGSSTTSLVDEEVTLPPPRSVYYRADQPSYNQIAWKSSHGPPKNTVHGPPSLNLYSPVSGTSPRSTGGAPPARPPRPPPLNLYPTSTKRPVNTGISPPSIASRAITFALPPNPRTIKAMERASTAGGSSSDPIRSSEDHDERASESSEETARCACAVISPDGNHVYPHRAPSRNEHAVANLPLPLPPSTRRTETTVDISNAPPPRRRYPSDSLGHSSSTPHLPSQDKQILLPLPPLPSRPSNRQADDVSSFPLSLFPPPPQSPLFIRRKVAKNLVLRPSPTTAGGPTSPSLASEYTPLATPTSPRFQNSPNLSQSCSSFPRYFSSRTIPPPFDPPTTPLPTPPTSPATPTARAGTPSLKSLRSIKSINQLNCEKPLPPIVHRFTSSEPSDLEDGKININPPRQRVLSRHTGTHQAHSLAGRHTRSQLLGRQTPCGFAFEDIERSKQCRCLM